MDCLFDFDQRIENIPEFFPSCPSYFDLRFTVYYAQKQSLNAMKITLVLFKKNF